MKKKTESVLEKICYGILIVCGVGLIFALTGLFFKVDFIYYSGLILASPLFIVVLPACLLLMALFPIAGIYGIICWLKHKANANPNNNNNVQNDGILNNQ